MRARSNTVFPTRSALPPLPPTPVDLAPQEPPTQESLSDRARLQTGRLQDPTRPSQPQSTRGPDRAVPAHLPTPTSTPSTSSLHDPERDINESQRDVMEVNHEEAPESLGGDRSVSLEAELEMKNMIETLVMQQAIRERRLLSSLNGFGARSQSRRKWLLIVLSSQARVIANHFALPTISNLGIFVVLNSTFSSALEQPSTPASTSASVASEEVKMTRERVLVTEGSWKLLWADYLEGGRGEAVPIPEANGLPIAGRLEFCTELHRPASESLSSQAHAQGHTRPQVAGRPYISSAVPSLRSSRRSELLDFTDSDSADSSSGPEESYIPTTFRNQISSTSTRRVPPLSSQYSDRTANRPPVDIPIPPVAQNFNHSAFATPLRHLRAGFGRIQTSQSTPILRSPSLAAEETSFSAEHEVLDEVDTGEVDLDEPTLNWTYELDRLREVSESALLMDSSAHQSDDQVGEAFQKHREISPSLAPKCRPCADPCGPTLLAGSSSYPFLNIYPAVYPHIEIYPKLPAWPPFNRDSLADSLASSSPQDKNCSNPETDSQPEGQAPPATKAPIDLTETTVSETAYDTSIDWYLSSTPSENSIQDSPETSSCDGEGEGGTDSEGEGVFALYGGNMLATIQEESYTRSLTAQMEANDSMCEEALADVPVSDSEGEETGRSYPVCVNTLYCRERTRASISDPADFQGNAFRSRPTSLELAKDATQPSPLPSPTIRPASGSQALATTLQTQSFTESDLEAREYEEAMPGASCNDPAAVREAFDLEDSPEIHPLSFSADEYDFDSDDGHEFSLDTEEMGEGDESCQTFDHLLPLPTLTTPKSSQPILFAFPSAEGSDFVEAVTQFILEAQNQSIARRGVFRVALGLGHKDLSRRLVEAIQFNPALRCDRWEVYVAESEDDLLTGSPLHSARIFCTETVQSSQCDLVLLDLANRWNGTIEEDPKDQARNDPKLPISLVESARRLAIFACGSDRRAELAKSLKGPLSPEAQSVVYFADADAVEGLDYARTSFWAE
ncbi:uncharacterized protein JCM15063_003135 [Sporobolomyces koalae]|uniref:uncharacterized protein n=1 Tax=Sporobolomyces koalae TaxID=500713 RepID=UPI0031768A4D